MSIKLDRTAILKHLLDVAFHSFSLQFKGLAVYNSRTDVKIYEQTQRNIVVMTVIVEKERIGRLIN